MRKTCRLLLFLLAANISTITGYAQAVTISGTVRNSITKEPIPSVSVIVKGSTSGTFTNDKGAFKLNVDKIPVVLIVSSVGYENQELTVSSIGTDVALDLVPASSLG